MKKYLLFFVFLLSTLYLTAQIPDGYYTSANNLKGDSLKNALYQIIKGHTEYPYTASTTDVWDILKETDRDPNNFENVILLYSGLSVNAAQEYNDGNGWTREHVWAKSRGDFGTDPGPGTDVHHLRPASNDENTMRSNRWFAHCEEMYYLNGVATGSYYSNSEWLWEPRDEVKGDVARMMFYMATRYEGENGEPDLELIDYIPADQSTNEPIHAKLSDLLVWNQQDPVSDFERNRNEVIYGYQHNRNPYIDHPEYVTAVFGTPQGAEYAPESPSDLKIAILQNGLKLFWSDQAIETEYIIYRSENNVDFDSIASNMADIVEFIDSSAVIGNEYWYYVLAKNDLGTSADIFVAHVNYQLASDLMITEYVEGSSYNKAIEISNFTANDINLANYSLRKQTNGVGDWSADFVLSGNLLYGESYVVANSSAGESVIAKSDSLTTSDVLGFNGDDAVSLWKNGNLIDIVGVFNSSDIFATDVTLIRKANISSPSAEYISSQWTVEAQDYFEDLDSHFFGGTLECKIPDNLSSEKESENSFIIRWCDCTSADSYKIRYKAVDNTDWIEMDVLSNSVRLSDLQFSAEYEVQVSAICSGIISDYSSSINFTTDAEQTGIESLYSKYKVYPNPAHNFINIDNYQNTSLEIFTLSGQKVKRVSLVKAQVDISDLKNGMYILRIIDGKKMIHMRLIKN